MLFIVTPVSLGTVLFFASSTRMHQHFVSRLSISRCVLWNYK